MTASTYTSRSATTTRSRFSTRRRYKNIGELPSGPDPEQFALDPAGKMLYVANENDAMVTAIDVATR